MDKKYCRLIRLNKIIVSTLIVIATLTACGISKADNSEKNVIETSINQVVNKNSNIDTFDVNVGIYFSITLDDKVKGVDSNIIRATRQAMFDYYCYNARFSHYDGYSITGDVVIMDVKKTQKCTWEVYYVPKDAIANYPNWYSVVTVEKQKSGSYKGIMSHHGSPMVKGDSTSKTDDSPKNVIETKINELVNKNFNADTFNVNVSICFSITLDDKVKGVNPNIIRATRQVIFDSYCHYAKFSHYDGYSTTGHVVIMDVKETKKDTWEVYYVQKDAIANYPNEYSLVTVEKQKSGSYKGIMFDHGGPLVREDETY